MSSARKKTVLINCSNLHVGGGVAVASSFIDCLSKINLNDLEVCILLSSSVSDNLKNLGTDLSVFFRCDVVNYFGFSALWSGLDRFFRDMDLVFTVFGPAYTLFSPKKHVVGFAQPNIIYPVNPVSKSLRLFDKVRSRFKYKVQELFFSKADLIVVELEHVRIGLRKLRLFRNKKIEVVYSAVHSVYREPAKWSELYLPISKGSLKLGIISRNYPHKNLSILPAVKNCLREKYGLIVDFYVTFQPEEWENCDEVFRGEVINAGGLSLSQCPSFYSFLDGVIFPSLLECFSAVPIETMMIRKPLFASDLPFMRDVCGDNCNYFNPLDVHSIAYSIHCYFNLPVYQQLARIDAAYYFVKKYPGPNERAEKYISIIRDLLVGDTSSMCG